MRLTRRGWMVVAAVIVAVGSAGLFGARALNAIAVPGIVALGAAAVQVFRVDPPRVVRELPPVANRGDVLTVRLRFHAESSFAARVLDHLDFGLAGDGNDVETTVSSGPLQYELECIERGEKRVGPTRIEVRDVLGLLAGASLAGNVESLTVRPRVYPIAGRRRQELLAVRGGERQDRQVFEHLREYDRGDALRDVHWKTSAKQPDDELVVKEFTSDDEHRGVVVAAEAAPGTGDEMADAAASVAVDLLEEGYDVELVTPTATLGPDAGTNHRDDLLDHLSTVDSGQPKPSDRSRANLLVSASNRGVTVAAGGRSVPFDEYAMTVAEPGDGRGDADRRSVATS